jgi:hypothetical protein
MFPFVSQGTYQNATWRGIPVAVKKLDDDLIMDEDKVWVGSIELLFFFLVRHGSVSLNCA